MTCSPKSAHSKIDSPKNRSKKMKKSRFSEEQIIRILKEGAAGAKIVELCRRHNLSKATYYGWKRRYEGLEVPELRRLKSLETESRMVKFPSFSAR